MRRPKPQRPGYVACAERAGTHRYGMVLQEGGRLVLVLRGHRSLRQLAGRACEPGFPPEAPATTAHLPKRAGLELDRRSDPQELDTRLPGRMCWSAHAVEDLDDGERRPALPGRSEDATDCRLWSGPRQRAGIAPCLPVRAVRPAARAPRPAGPLRERQHRRSSRGVDRALAAMDAGIRMAPGHERTHKSGSQDKREQSLHAKVAPRGSLHA